MTTCTAPLPQADPNCTTCRGTGTDQDFGGTCVDCVRPPAKTNMENRLTAHKPTAAPTVDPALIVWLEAQTWSDFATSVAAGYRRYGKLSEKQLASVTKMKATCDAKAAAPAKPASGLDLSGVPTGMYAVPNGDTRLKLDIDNLTKGKWAGWVFVKDGAVYGEGKRYGKQRPGGTYQGDVEDALRIIAADPRAASAAYGQLTGTCGVCRRHLEDETSVALGIGPVCRAKYGW